MRRKRTEEECEYLMRKPATDWISTYNQRESEPKEGIVFTGMFYHRTGCVCTHYWTEAEEWLGDYWVDWYRSPYYSSWVIVKDWEHKRIYGVKTKDWKNWKEKSRDIEGESWLEVEKEFMEAMED